MSPSILKVQVWRYRCGGTGVAVQCVSEVGVQYEREVKGEHHTHTDIKMKVYSVYIYIGYILSHIHAKPLHEKTGTINSEAFRKF